MNVQRTGFRRTEICDFGEDNEIAVALDRSTFLIPARILTGIFYFMPTSETVRKKLHRYRCNSAVPQLFLRLLLAPFQKICPRALGAFPRSFQWTFIFSTAIKKKKNLFVCNSLQLLKLSEIQNSASTNVIYFSLKGMQFSSNRFTRLPLLVNKF